MQDSRLPPGEGSPGHHGRRRPPSFPPSLLLALPLSPSLARCRSRGPPAGNLLWIKSRYLRKREKRKDLLRGKEKKDRPSIAFIFHAVTIGRPQFRRPGLGPAAAEVCRACCLAHADRRARCAACSTLWAAAPTAAQTPSGPQGPFYRLNIRLPASPPATAREPALLCLRPKSIHNPPCRCSCALPGHPSWPRSRLGHTRAAARPRTSNLAPCATHTKP
ncbi:uncharacterized protein LOC126931174 [Macaca thibetana thibetana]|uniref:uncharacterized protein LOC126931174 n=1 Tax=Macaca thibetana thibetana TaxID=257877 RepID=UPI0021BC92BF|nr:uncharacterized protein LOC126931174 [Macaca thibetana thibetana]